ncbi:predicted protein [Sclerotinia sclerotiorum 1980 UF-70]|uniref:Uncharacterized protein n=2 Tax=Sclerotinia sclerotiorum (strain ATCC 18683 / 1980 / Ss-1) TaxID=665079 RepID=A7EZF3_SCLS1|nr:predicted protein [Sclerotinia sclerotiorum 1980 UF-70]APA12270.1 hypothetical protein sscle_09g070400 [Sclerotinia sclerotiorum 1980 UF-70]EDN94845.1 predicted protein [Sclerotinia sclerotiorum 1980 UF-70]
MLIGSFYPLTADEWIEMACYISSEYNTDDSEDERELTNADAEESESGESGGNQEMSQQVIVEDDEEKSK